MTVSFAPVTDGHTPRTRPSGALRVVPDAGSRSCPLVGVPEEKTRRHRERPTRARCLVDQRPVSRVAARRRRVLLGTAVAALLAALALPWSGTGGHPLANPGPALAGEVVAHHSPYVVQVGDTLWSIAERLDPTGDPRPVVTQLAAQVRSDTIIPGEHLVLP